MRLLLVEDDPMIGAGVQRALRDEGYTVDWVHDGVAAELAIAGNPYAVVLLDLGLPRRDGISLLEQLRSAGNTIPVLIIVGAVVFFVLMPAAGNLFSAPLLIGLVMGAYGHYGLTRLRGSATRHMLRHMTMPILLSH